MVVCVRWKEAEDFWQLVPWSIASKKEVPITDKANVQLRRMTLENRVRVDLPEFTPRNSALHDACNHRMTGLHDFIDVETTDLRKISRLGKD